ncbi:hypothetical protein IE81DRAFT_289465 [Ceraceosorus guamensis]|uniref:Alpha/beta-hydrolase n=1 Tax=Ceraceosorus guamensis TaxID=1522189 RepID=A0A316VZW2_9BASI|nr:hypothetical protein IE81DRAFT_289465 [Ceraceosorus guamensis]PWN42969.1 hypothetical protein IE81DRAFT_289465 [Ceraceosorus guamensis]
MQQAQTDPIGAARQADSLEGVWGNTQGGGNLPFTLISGDSESDPFGPNNQYSWNRNVDWVPNANANPAGDDAQNTQGWTGLPDVVGFQLNRTWEVVPGATQPFYISAGWQDRASTIKRAVITMPGKPRDSWKYSQLIRIALNVTVTNFQQYGLTNFDDVVVIGPAWLNQFDQEYGASRPTDLIFHGSQWQSGGYSRSPNLTRSITTYDVLDAFTDWLFDQKQFPALTSVAFAGHSMGGQAVQRYALLKKTKAYDRNIHYWIGNPGSWAWLSDSRTFPTSNCSATFDEWQYGLGGNQTKVSKYARKDVIANRQDVVDRFKTRNVHYGLGLLDNGAGDTHCEAITQGGNHLNRGNQFVLAYENNGGFPSTHTVDYVPNATHQDYSMISWNFTLQRLFTDGIQTRQPALTDLRNPGDKNKTTGAVPNPPPRAFATPIHKIVAYALLGGSVAGTALAFFILPFLFSNNTSTWEQEQWEAESKRKLL